MTKQQEKMVDMLMGFHSICEQNNIWYYLIGNQLLFAAQNGSIHGYEVEVAMFASELEKLQKVLEKERHTEIEFETVADLGNMPGCYLRYVNRNTLLLNLDYFDMYAKPGIAICIYVIRDQSGAAKKLASYERGMRDLSRMEHSVAARRVMSMKNSRGAQEFAGFLSELEKSVRSHNPDAGTSLKEVGGGFCTFPPGFWKKRTRITFMGRSFYTVENYAAYLRKRFGLMWSGASPNIPKETYRCMFSAQLPYGKYMEAIHAGGVVTPEFREQCRKFVADSAVLEAMTKEEAAGWRKSMFAAGERFRLRKKYMPVKERVQELMDRQCYDEAELILNDYIQTLETYAKDGVIICFDRDILAMVIKIYEINGQTDRADTIREKVLPEDLEPIEVTW